MVFGKLVSGSEKNEQTRQVADIRSRVLEEECGLKIEADRRLFACMPLRMKGIPRWRPEELLLTVKLPDPGSGSAAGVSTEIWRFYCAAADRQGDAVRSTDD